MAEIVKNLPFEDYLSRRAVSVSALKQFAKAPALAHFAREETAALRMGSLVHCAVLEPAELDRRYQPTELERRGTKAWAAEEEAAGGRELVKIADWDDARRMADAVWAHPIARQLLEGCEVEVSGFWTDPETGLECKGRADIHNPRIGMLGDLKTCCDASPRAFERDFAKFKYGWQAAWYLDGFMRCGMDLSAFIFIAVEKEPPHLAKAYRLAPSQMDDIRAIVRHHLAEYADCLTLNDWPGYGNSIHDIYLPNWELELPK